GNAGVVVLTSVGVAVLDGRAQRLLEINRVLNMKAIHGVTASPVAIALLRVSYVGIVKLLLKHPGVVEVVFHACSIDTGLPAVAVDKKHIVAFPPPSSGKPEGIQDGSDILPLTFGLHEDIIVLAIQVPAARFGLWNGTGELMVPLRMEAG